MHADNRHNSPQRAEERETGPPPRGVIPVWAQLRQFRYPREFRIAAPVWPSRLWPGLEALAHVAPLPPSGDASTVDKEQGRLLADVGTGLWRLRQRMVDPETNEPAEGMARAYRHLDATWDALTQAGIQIRDHTGELFPEGGIYALKAIAFQPTPGLARETVLETIKPTIYYKEQMIQMGEVIVGTPEQAGHPTTIAE